MFFSMLEKAVMLAALQPEPAPLLVLP